MLRKRRRALTLSNIFGVSLKNRMVDLKEYTAGERRPVKRAECDDFAFLERFCRFIRHLLLHVTSRVRDSSPVTIGGSSGRYVASRRGKSMEPRSVVASVDAGHAFNHANSGCPRDRMPSA